MVEIRKLKNNITLILEESSQYSTVAFGVWIKVGSKYENISNNGISHLVEHMLFKGTKKRTAAQISKDTAYLGGNINAYTSKENTSYYGRTLPDYLPLLIDLLGDMICNSIIDENELEMEKGVICEEIDMYKDSPDDYVHEKLQKSVWKDHPLGYYISGDKETVKGFTKKDVEDFMNEHYTGDNMIISLAGKFNKEDTIKLIENTFESINENKSRIDLLKPVYNKVSIIKKKDIEQLHMNIAFPGADLNGGDRYAFTLLNSIIGGDVNSRLFQEIREKRGLTYSVYSYGSSFREAGLFHIYAAMNPDQGERVFGLIKDTILDIIKTGVKDFELEDAKHQIIVEMTMNRDNVVTRMNSNAKSFIGYNRVIPFEDTINKLRIVELKDMEDIINKYINIEQMSTGVVGAIENISYL